MTIVYSVLFFLGETIQGGWEGQLRAIFWALPYAHILILQLFNRRPYFFFFWATI